MRGDPTILPSLPELGGRTGDAVLASPPCVDDDPETWLAEGLGIVSAWLAELTGLGLLGVL